MLRSFCHRFRFGLPLLLCTVLGTLAGIAAMHATRYRSVFPVSPSGSAEVTAATGSLVVAFDSVWDDLTSQAASNPGWVPVLRRQAIPMDWLYNPEAALPDPSGWTALLYACVRCPAGDPAAERALAARLASHGPIRIPRSLLQTIQRADRDSPLFAGMERLLHALEIDEAARFLSILVCNSERTTIPSTVPTLISDACRIHGDGLKDRIALRILRSPELASVLYRALQKYKQSNGGILGGLKLEK